jgi:hypothetical protein
MDEAIGLELHGRFGEAPVEVVSNDYSVIQAVGCVKPAKTYRRFGGSRTRKTGEAVQPKRLKPYSGFG